MAKRSVSDEGSATLAELESCASVLLSAVKSLRLRHEALLQAKQDDVDLREGFSRLLTPAGCRRALAHATRALDAGLLVYESARSRLSGASLEVDLGHLLHSVAPLKTFSSVPDDPDDPGDLDEDPGLGLADAVAGAARRVGEHVLSVADAQRARLTASPSYPSAAPAFAEAGFDKRIQGASDLPTEPGYYLLTTPAGEVRIASRGDLFNEGFAWHVLGPDLGRNHSFFRDDEIASIFSTWRSLVVCGVPDEIAEPVAAGVPVALAPLPESWCRMRCEEDMPDDAGYYLVRAPCGEVSLVSLVWRSGVRLWKIWTNGKLRRDSEVLGRFAWWCRLEFSRKPAREVLLPATGGAAADAWRDVRSGGDLPAEPGYYLAISRDAGCLPFVARLELGTDSMRGWWVSRPKAPNSPDSHRHVMLGDREMVAAAARVRRLIP